MKHQTAFRAIFMPAFLVFLLAMLFTPSAARSAVTANLDGISFETATWQDVLTLSLSDWRIPKISRYGMVNRIVVEFDDTVPRTTLQNLIAGKRGGCVEKFEVHTFRSSASADVSAGIRMKLAKPTTLLVAYVEAGVDIKINIVGDLAKITYYRIEEVPPQTRPAPINQIENITVTKDGPAEYLTIETTRSTVPSIFQVASPDRLVITFSSTYTNPRVNNQTFRIMETSTNFRLELLGLGTMPHPYSGLDYSSLDKSGQFHFVGIPTPLGNTKYSERISGIQQNDSVIVVYPNKNVDFHISRNSGNIFELAFVKRIERSSATCELCKKQALDEKPFVYQVIDEENRILDFSLD